MAKFLGLSLNGYGSIERGDTDVGLSRLEQISSLFNVSLCQLFAFGDENSDPNTAIQTNRNPVPNEYDYLKQKFEFEKQKVINELQEKEIAHLKEINQLKEKEVAYLKEINELKEMEILHLKMQSPTLLKV